MKQSDIFRENAENCAHLAEAEPKYHRYKRMEAAWLGPRDCAQGAARSPDMSAHPPQVQHSP
jgi:hypothetical protein